MTRKDKIINIIRGYNDQVKSAKLVLDSARQNLNDAIANNANSVIIMQQTNILNQAQSIVNDIERRFNDFMYADWDNITDDQLIT